MRSSLLLSLFVLLVSTSTHAMTVPIETAHDLDSTAYKYLNDFFRNSDSRCFMSYRANIAPGDIPSVYGVVTYRDGQKEYNKLIYKQTASVNPTEVSAHIADVTTKYNLTNSCSPVANDNSPDTDDMILLDSSMTAE